MRCPWCRNFLPFTALLGSWPRACLFWCPKCQGLARHGGHRDWYLRTLAAVACVVFVVPISRDLRGAIVLVAYWLLRGCFRELVPVGDGAFAGGRGEP